MLNFTYAIWLHAKCATLIMKIKQTSVYECRLCEFITCL